MTEEQKYSIVDARVTVIKDHKHYEGKFNGAKLSFPVLYVFALDAQYEYSWEAAQRIVERGTITL